MCPPWLLPAPAPRCQAAPTAQARRPMNGLRALALFDGSSPAPRRSRKVCMNLFGFGTQRRGQLCIPVPCSPARMHQGLLGARGELAGGEFQARGNPLPAGSAKNARQPGGHANASQPSLGGERYASWPQPVPTLPAPATLAREVLQSSHCSGWVKGASRLQPARPVAAWQVSRGMQLPRWCRNAMTKSMQTLRLTVASRTASSRKGQLLAARSIACG